MKDLSLPEPIEAYFEADRRDGQAVARCFTADATVFDEGRTHAGLAAIEAWKTAASAQFSYLAEPFALEQKDRKYIVTSRVTGDFPGSPVDLQYAFTLERGKISSLEIKP
ncbi:nuclear transport factor 2 family protein [Steroidobacter sp. S1-65]|uniref:Nuclear transport factor 2 family protein n=1 Tax=Steroidobacter gossypii TaxID=2805490 RepID=A0ABS1WV93_9GAMM|nr:nuclear transport factor 2 family protein [Steroidobacter gossypii]MBM0104893.1 nuclear transport factor 2 family protein [Steroidobacter gossypii]